MDRLFAVARDLQRFFDDRQWRFCFIGALAVNRWGEPRFTRDVDVTLFCGFGREQEYAEGLLAAGYQERIPDAVAFGLKSRVLLFQAPDGYPVDVALGALPYEDEMIERSSTYEFVPGIILRTCSAEDLIVMKLFASRAIDLRDAETVAIRNRKSLDWEYIERNLQPLAELKEAPEIMTALARLRSL